MSIGSGVFFHCSFSSSADLGFACSLQFQSFHKYGDLVLWVLDTELLVQPGVRREAALHVAASYLLAARL